MFATVVSDFGDRPCIVCARVRDDPLHNPGERGGLAHENVEPRVNQHTYDPGERRQSVRREAERIKPGDRRRAVRRMEDRIRLIEDAVQVRGATEVSLREASGDREAVGEGNSQVQATPQEGEREEEVTEGTPPPVAPDEPAEAAEEVAEPTAEAAQETDADNQSDDSADTGADAGDDEDEEDEDNG